MQIELEWMQCFLRDAERRKGESHRVRNWVFQIRETTYDVEDLIEHFVFKSALRNQKGAVNRIKKYAFFINHLVELHQMGSRIKAIKVRLATLRTRLQIYGIRELKVGGEGELKVGGEEVYANGASVTRRRKRQDYSHVVDHNVVGLDEKITELVKRLVNVGGQRDHGCRPAPASVVCLHGMGGVGKTTTAKKVYGDRRIRAHFEGFAWVYISQQFTPRQVWELILTQLSDKEDVKSMSDDELNSKLCGLQKDKKCLLVIDDIWNNQDWVKLSTAFPYMDEDSKSKMLLTTRNEGVASHGVHVYYTNLNVLDHNNSLRLLTDTILFLGGSNHPIKEDSDMKKYAEEMVKQCGGLPLAIIVLGGILATKHEPIKWERVGANIKLVLKRDEQEGNGVISVLESSYEDLPYNLRSCFLYFSQYREDEEIKTTELKQKWIAEGFVSSAVEEGGETMEDIAEEYLHELVRRCIIQVGRRGHTGRVKTCRIHDLMRDLCVAKAKEEGFAHSINLWVENEGRDLKKVSFRRLCISSCNHKLSESVLSSLGRISPHLRSIWFHDNLDDKEAVLIVKKLKLVRVLELPSTMGKSGRKQIGNLIHLRFLDLGVSMLPTSMGNLICLQTLNLERCDSDLKIPDSVWRMEQLRHLYLPRDGCVCENREQHVSHFKNLQTLVNFPPKNFDLQRNLAKFINVRKLVIANRSEEMCNILQSEGMGFNRVESLSFTSPSENVDLEAVTRSCPCLYRLLVFAPIKFTATASCSVVWPSNLTKLVLRHSGLDENHMSSLGKLQSLKVLFLYVNAFKGKQMIFHQNDFPQLQHLVLQNLKDLKAWVVHDGGLPRLSCLEVINCLKLKSVGDGTQYLKQLKELKVRSMPFMFTKKLEVGGEDWDRVRNVPSISFSYCYPELEIDDHRSSGLDENGSLELLNKTILSLGGADHPIREDSEVYTSVREMVKICGGVRPAVNVLGGILARKHEIKEWQSIELVLKEGERKGKDGVTSVLELSYEDLPCNLKSCFLYFSQYLRGEEIETTEMIQKWIGEGFVTSSMDETMEDVGQEHLNELVGRLLIQVGKRSHTGRVKTCRMNGLVWHFCVSKAKEEGFSLSLRLGGDGDHVGTILKNVKFRRLCISSIGSNYEADLPLYSLQQMSPQLISVRFVDDLNRNHGEYVKWVCRNLKLVQVLTLPTLRLRNSICDLQDFEEEIGRNLVHLTFLKLGSLLATPPKSIGNSRCLQTLNLERCKLSSRIPDSVWVMEQLRHLYLPERGSYCESRRQQVGDFLNLQTLVNFPPRHFDLQQNLVKFTNVRKLVVIKEVEEMGRILRSQKIMFNRLQSLSCRFKGEVDLEAFTRACPCVYRLNVNGPVKFPADPSCTAIWPSNLTKLILTRTKIDQNQLGSLAKLQSLQVLFLQDDSFAGKEMVFHTNDFPQLHRLSIAHLKHLKTWAVHEGALPNLVCLEIVRCGLKERIVKEMGRGFIKRDWDRVSHVPSISFID